MQIWTDNEIKRAYENMVYAQVAFNKFPSKQTWCSFCEAYNTWAKLYNKECSFSSLVVLYSNKWLD